MWLQDPNLLALPVNAPEAGNSFPGTSWQGYGMIDPAGQIQLGGRGLGICTFSGLPRIPGHVQVGEWAGWMTVAVSLSKCGAEGALESARHCPQPSSLQRPSKVRTVLPILEMRRWKLRAISQGMAELPALKSPSLACHTWLYTPSPDPGHWTI